MRYAINGNRHQQGHLEDIDRLLTEILKRGFDIVMAEPFLNYLADNLGSSVRAGIDYLPLTTPPDADMAVSIGGDGAFLKTARWIGNRQIPIAGINTGHLGYLSSFSFDDPQPLHRALLEGDLQITSRDLIQAHVRSSCGNNTLTALNEIAITRGDSPAMLDIEVTINGHSPLNYRGDGLILGTPTGSTAYNLSVGGPILSPSLEGWVLSPIAAHSLSMRPLVVSNAEPLDICVHSRADGYRLAADGKAISLPLDARIHISRAPYVVRMIKQAGQSFTDTLRNKLGWGER